MNKQDLDLDLDLRTGERDGRNPLAFHFWDEFTQLAQRLACIHHLTSLLWASRGTRPAHRRKCCCQVLNHGPELFQGSFQGVTVDTS
jgi:hypothetical protein